MLMYLAYHSSTLEAGKAQRVFLFAALFSLFFTALGAPAFGSPSISQFADRYSGSVARIVAFDARGNPSSMGTGFFVSGDGDIATCHHVLAGSVKAQVETLEGRKGRILEVLKDDPELDLLVARTSLKNTTPLALGDSRRIKKGEDILSIGTGAGGGRSISVGRIRAIRESEGLRLLETTAPIMQGNSGAPILGYSGKVIAVATAFLPLRDLFYFAMPVDYLKTLPPCRLELRSLPKAKTRLEATVKDETLLDVCLTPYEAKERREDGQRRSRPSASIPHWVDLRPADGRGLATPGAVYFRNGKKLLFDRAWRDRDTVILLMHGKTIAVGYDISEIDLERSFHSKR
jgi:S1-C subfamily serine protease